MCLEKALPKKYEEEQDVGGERTGQQLKVGLAYPHDSRAAGGPPRRAKAAKHTEAR